ncbi:phage major capsid protein [Methylocystis sp. H4A]|uniref:phage major capsid protein n=1 Tax=Methylocystis sp. H4A TaxID=2785788 RepID=UPI0018C20061|nr:phage major capsid protein [Methylocystis sp. H4A]MBG0802121.1 phage major capsid protein [Methylocystis sp. H4A]
MLESVKISRRQSEIRQALAGLVGKSDASEDEIRSMETMDAEYRTNETRYRASLIAEDNERREAGKDLETRGDRECADLVSKFELRQVALALDEGRALNGQTAEIVTEMRAKGGYRGIPVPWGALERRAGETVASGIFDPKQVRPVIDRLFPDSVAARMGGQMIAIDSGLVEIPLTTSSVTAGWAANETSNVAGPTVFATTERTLSPEQNLGIQVKLTRQSMKQSGDALEQAVRRDISGTMQTVLDSAVFNGAGAAGVPLGVIAGQATYAYGTTAVSAAASAAAFRAVAATFIGANAANGPGDVRVLMHPQTWSYMDGQLVTNTAVSQWDLHVKNFSAGNNVLSTLATLTVGAPDTSVALLTTNAGGVAPFVIGAWGGIDMIRDPYSDAQAGMLRLTALATFDVNILRSAQLHLLTALTVE